MVDVKTFPTTEEELFELGPGPHRFPASLEEFAAVTYESELRTEYINGELVLMSYATLLHELIVGELISLLKAALSEGYYVVPSSHRVYQSFMTRSFAPDVFVVKGGIKQSKPAGKVSMVTNPWLIVEVLSPGTETYDLGTKLTAYKKFPSVEYILYVHQLEQRATLHFRSSATLWRSEDFGPEQPEITIGDAKFSLIDIYRNLPDEEE